MKLFRWLFWCLWYSFRREPKDLRSRLVRDSRIWFPGDFQPYILRSESCGRWTITFGPDADYQQLRMMKVWAHVSIETGKVVGLTIYDEALNLPPAPPATSDTPTGDEG